MSENSEDGKFGAKQSIIITREKVRERETLTAPLFSLGCFVGKLVCSILETRIR